MTVVQEPIEDRGRDDRVAEDNAPFPTARFDVISMEPRSFARAGSLSCASEAEGGVLLGPGCGRTDAHLRRRHLRRVSLALVSKSAWPR